MEQDAHIEGALAAEASLVVLDTLESVVQADGGGGSAINCFLIFRNYTCVCVVCDKVNRSQRA